MIYFINSLYGDFHAKYIDTQYYNLLLYHEV